MVERSETTQTLFYNELIKRVWTLAPFSEVMESFFVACSTTAYVNLDGHSMLDCWVYWIVGFCGIFCGPHWNFITWYFTGPGLSIWASNKRSWQQLNVFVKCPYKIAIIIERGTTPRYSTDFTPSLCYIVPTYAESRLFSLKLFLSDNIHILKNIITLHQL